MILICSVKLQNTLANQLVQLRGHTHTHTNCSIAECEIKWLVLPTWQNKPVFERYFDTTVARVVVFMPYEVVLTQQIRNVCAQG